MPKKEVKELTTETIVFKAVGELKEVTKKLQEISEKTVPMNAEVFEGTINNIKEMLGEFVEGTTKIVEDLSVQVKDLNKAFVNFAAKPQVVVPVNAQPATSSSKQYTKGEIFQALRDSGVDQSKLSVEGSPGKFVVKTGYINEPDVYSKVSKYLKGAGFTFKSEGKNSRWLQ